jgi:hypothetical protein
MKLRNVAIIAGTTLLCIKPDIEAQNRIDSKLPEIARSLMRWTLGDKPPISGEPVPPPPPERLTRMQSDLDQRLSALSNIICHEQITRYLRDGKVTRQLDLLETDVEVAKGVEKYSSIRRKNKLYSDIFKVPGTWSVGEVVTLVRTTRDALDLPSGLTETDDNSDLGPTRLTTFRYPASANRWYLKVKGEILWLPFEGHIWTNAETGEILRLSWRANQLPPESGVSEVLWTVDFKPVDLASMVLTLPQEAFYQVAYRNGENRADWNITRFSGYRRFAADSAIRFDE